MTKEQIIDMARQAGFDPHDMSADFTCNLDNIEAFAKLLAEHERDACERCKQLEEQAYDLLGKLKVANIKLSMRSQRTWVGLMRGVRVDGDTVVITVKGGNDAARELCGALIEEMNK
jgi:hypothetical protein